MKTVHLQTQLPDATVEGLEGQYLDAPDYDGQPVAEDAVVYKPNGDVLFKLVHNSRIGSHFAPAHREFGRRRVGAVTASFETSSRPRHDFPLILKRLQYK